MQHHPQRDRAGVFDARLVFRKRIVERERAAPGEHQDRRGRELLRQRADGKACVRVDRRAVLDVGEAEAAAIDDRPVSDDHECESRRLAARESVGPDALEHRRWDICDDISRSGGRQHRSNGPKREQTSRDRTPEPAPKRKTSFTHRFRSNVEGLQVKFDDFRIETQQGFVRVERRLGNIETRLEHIEIANSALERRVTTLESTRDSERPSDSG